MAQRAIDRVVSPGDHLQVIIPEGIRGLPLPGILVRRHGIYVDENCVIQMDSLFSSGLRIEPVAYAEFAKFGPAICVRHRGFSPARLWIGASLPPDQVIANAQRLAMNASSYTAYTPSAGCVQAANWCVTGFRRPRRLLGRLGWLIFATGGLLVAYASSWHPGFLVSIAYLVGAALVLAHERFNKGGFIPPD